MKAPSSRRLCSSSATSSSTTRCARRRGASSRTRRDRRRFASPPRTTTGGFAHHGKDANADALAAAPGFEPARGATDGRHRSGAFGAPRGAFAGRPCARAAAKPPGAHHCSTTASACGRWTTTVRSWRTASARTPRHFLLFVGYVALGNLYGICLCFLAARTRRAAGGAVAFLDALGSKRRFRHVGTTPPGDARWRCVRIENAQSFSRSSPAATAKRCRSGSPRDALTRGTRRVYAARGSRAWSPRRSTRRRTGSGGGRAALRRRDHLRRDLLLFWATLRGVAAGETFVESLKRNRRHPEASSRRVSEPAEPTTSVSKTRRSRAHLETHALFKSL